MARFLLQVNRAVKTGGAGSMKGGAPRRRARYSPAEEKETPMLYQQRTAWPFLRAGVNRH